MTFPRGKGKYGMRYVGDLETRYSPLGSSCKGVWVYPSVIELKGRGSGRERRRGWNIIEVICVVSSTSMAKKCSR